MSPAEVWGEAPRKKILKNHISFLWVLNYRPQRPDYGDGLREYIN